MDELKGQHTKEVEKLREEFASKEADIKANLSASQNSSVNEIESLKKSLETAKSEYEAGLKAAHDKNALENKKRLQAVKLKFDKMDTKYKSEIAALTKSNDENASKARSSMEELENLRTKLKTSEDKLNQMTKEVDELSAAKLQAEKQIEDAHSKHTIALDALRKDHSD